MNFNERLLNYFKLPQLTSFNMDSMTRTQMMGTLSIFFVYNFIILMIGAGLALIFDNLQFIVSSNLTSKFFFIATIIFHMYFGSSLMMLCNCGYQQLVTLNAILTKNLNDSDQQDLIDVIKKTAKMYDKLCDVFDEISTFYVFFILLVLLGFLHYNVFFVYALYILFNNLNPSILLFVIGTFLWVIYFAPCVIYLTLFSSLIESEAYRTADLVQMLVNRNMDLRSLRKASIFSLHVSHRIPKLSCGMFEINWRTFFGIMGSIFSFSIILIQFYDVTKE